jgi:hypothetical protein
MTIIVNQVLNFTQSLYRLNDNPSAKELFNGVSDHVPSL